MKKLLIINTSLSEDKAFAYSIRKVVEGDVVHYSSLTPDIINSYEKIIISGCPITERFAVAKELKHFRWIKKFEKPILGICCGHQIIGKVFGSRLIHDIEKEIGRYHVYLNHRHPILKYVKSNFVAEELHTDSITLPKEFMLLAHSDKCRVEIMKHKKKEIFGVEFHPEFSSCRILKNFVEM